MRPRGVGLPVLPPLPMFTLDDLQAASGFRRWGYLLPLGRSPRARPRWHACVAVSAAHNGAGAHPTDAGLFASSQAPVPSAPRSWRIGCGRSRLKRGLRGVDLCRSPTRADGTAPFPWDHALTGARRPPSRFGTAAMRKTRGEQEACGVGAPFHRRWDQDGVAVGGASQVAGRVRLVRTACWRASAVV